MTTAALLAVALFGADPRVLDESYKLTLVAAEPQLVTPVGIAFDDRGRMLFIESHTHFRPEGYEGPKADRIRIVELGEEGKVKSFRTYYEGTKYTMGLRPGPDGWMYVATRMEVFRLKDADGDGSAETREEIVRLETKGDYPHNGLSGLAIGPDSKLRFGMGENLGAPYEIIGKLYVGMGQNRGEPYDLHGKNGNRIAGGGEGGNIFQCDLDGSNLERIATGFWNPFGLCFDPHGRLFAVDNDPDASPPCRLLHVVPGGDYGFQFRYGRAGKHPLQAWDGELPGTLPMAAGTGEAPCAVIPHEGRLWVTSWGHNRIERFAMRPKGATVVGVPEIVVQGDANFRPVDMAVAENGDLYFTDWVDKSYPLHGKGRLWRLSKKLGAAQAAGEFPPLSEEELRAAEARSTPSQAALDSADPFLHQAGVWGYAKATPMPRFKWSGAPASGRMLHGLLEAWRLRDDIEEKRRDERLRLALKASVDLDRTAQIDLELYALRWIADERLTALREPVAQLLDDPATSPRLIRAAVATLDRLDREAGLTKQDDPLAGLVAILDDHSKPPAVRATALRLLPEGHKALSIERLAGLTAAQDATLKREAVRSLAAGNVNGRLSALAEIAADKEAPAEIRADSVVGLAAFPEEAGDLLSDLASDALPAVAAEAKRILNPADSQSGEKPSPDDLDAWAKVVGEGGDADAGWRVFFRQGGAACARCHTLDGRGTNVGPDLSGIGRRLDRARLLESILKPGKEVAPQYVPWTLVTQEGQVLTGLPVEVRDAPDGVEHFVGTDGKRFTLNTADVETRQASQVSVMPEGLEKVVSVEELRDLLALLEAE